MVSHFFILIGLGHGILTHGIFELIRLTDFFRSAVQSKVNRVVGAELLSVSFLCLFGQMALVASVFVQSKNGEWWLYTVGLILLWGSVIAHAAAIRNDNYAHLSVLSCLPFAYCTLHALVGQWLRGCMAKIGAKL
jgi:hypothetical protein